MEELILIEPSILYKEQIASYRKEFLASGDSMDGTSNLRKYDHIEDWLEWVSLAKHKETCSPDWVPDVQYLCIRKADDRLIGMIDIRLEMNEECFKFYGNIGYSIRPHERKKGYASRQLALALALCRKNRWNKVLITCDKNNIASAKTILQNGGNLENEIYDPNDNTITQRYWILC